MDFSDLERHYLLGSRSNDNHNLLHKVKQIIGWVILL